MVEMAPHQFMDEVQETFAEIDSLLAEHAALNYILDSKSCELTWYLKITLFDFFNKFHQILVKNLSLLDLDEFEWGCLKVTKEGFFIDDIKLNERVVGETCGNDYREVESLGKTTEVKMLIAFFMIPLFVNALFAPAKEPTIIPEQK